VAPTTVMFNLAQHPRRNVVNVNARRLRTQPTITPLMHYIRLQISPLKAGPHAPYVRRTCVPALTSESLGCSEVVDNYYVYNAATVSCGTISWRQLETSDVQRHLMQQPASNQGVVVVNLWSWFITGYL